MEEKKKISKGTIYLIAVVVFFVALYALQYYLGEDDREQAQFEECVSIIESNIEEYIDSDILDNYVSAHIDDIISDHDLFTRNDMDALYNDATQVRDEAYIDGWQECCVYYGIEDEVYYTDEEMAEMYGYEQPSIEYDPNETQFAVARARADASAKRMKEVYITPTGSKYHLSASCAGENAIPTTLEDAENTGYTPCAKCAQ